MANVSTKPEKEMTWTKAVLFGFAIAIGFFIFLGFIPSYFTYWWEGQTDNVIRIVNDLTGWEMQQYTTIRIRDAISMGYQTTVFAAAIIAVYIVMERRRRRLGQRGFEGVKEYLPGK